MRALPEPALHLRRPGLFSTVQDLGRTGYLSLGVTPAGALDTLSLRLVNALVGNAPGMAAIEMTYQGPELEVLADSVRVAIGGAPRVAITVRSPGGLQRREPPWRTIRLTRGDVLGIGSIDGASCAYLAIAGGLDLPAVLGSRSTYARGRLGGYRGRALQAGDRLSLVRAEAPAGGEVMLPHAPNFGDGGPIRIVFGPQDDMFTADAKRALIDQPFEVTQESDRMGLRLSGPELAHIDGYEIVSDGIPAGAIQVPGSRQPIVLLAERQTVGGYAKIATVCSADLPRIGRVRVGQAVRFEHITVDAAEDLRRAQHAALASMMAGVRPVLPPDAVDPAALERVALTAGFA